jgi:putative membrane protein
MSGTALSTLAAMPAHPPYGPGGFGGGWWFLLVPLLWIVLIATVLLIVGRRWRRAARDGYGPGGRLSPARQAEATLAQRYAQGEIDESEYRARLEVIRTVSGP